jgi:hypothetical protein
MDKAGLAAGESNIFQAEWFDEAKEMETLIRLFSKIKPESQKDYEACSSKADYQSGNQRSIFKTNLTERVILDAIPPPSPFFRRRKSSFAVPPGPSFVKEDVEPAT